jgi:hypothetical protein
VVWHHSIFLISLSWLYCISQCIRWRGCSGRLRHGRGRCGQRATLLRNTTWLRRTFFWIRRECKRPIPVATRSKVASETIRLLGLRVRMPTGRGCLSLGNIVCCQVEVSASGWSLVQRSPTECGVSKWVWLWIFDNEGALTHEVVLRNGCRGRGKIQKNTINTYRAVYLQCKKCEQ